MKLLVVTGIEQDFIAANETFSCDCEWIYRHEALKRRMESIVVFLPSTKKMIGYDTIMETVINKGFQIIDMMGE